jgi:hypothetical protein
MSKNRTFVQPITFKLVDCRFLFDGKLLLLYNSMYFFRTNYTHD